MTRNSALCLLLIALCLSWIAGDVFPRADLMSDREAWRAVIHKSFNSYSLWNFDPISIGITKLFPLLDIVAWQMILFFFGLILLWGHAVGVDWVQAISFALVFVFATLHLWGFDTVLISSVCWLPWLLLALLLSFEERAEAKAIGAVSAVIYFPSI